MNIGGISIYLLHFFPQYFCGLQNISSTLLLLNIFLNVLFCFDAVINKTFLFHFQIVHWKYIEVYNTFAYWSWILKSCWTHLLVPINRFFFSGLLRIFYIQDHVIWKQKISSFQIWMPFISFSCRIALAGMFIVALFIITIEALVQCWTEVVILIRLYINIFFVYRQGQPCLVPNLRGKASSILLLRVLLAVKFFLYIRLRKCPSIPSFLSACVLFCCERGLDFLNLFFN